MACRVMLDLRPVGFVIGLIIAVLGTSMALPYAVDVIVGDENAQAFLEGGFFCVVAGGLTAVACRHGKGGGLGVRQAFALTLGIWLAIPFFAALPLMIGQPEAGLLDAYFEAVSGITTTGASVFIGVDDLPPGVNLWRAMLNWMGGLGIAFLAMIFLPAMRVGGMQYFRTEGFDTLGKILPRAADIARELFFVYIGLTLMCVTAYTLLGMPPYEAVAHGLATIATGGFSPRAASFSGYGPGIEYAAVGFMLLGSLPYIRYVQLMRGTARPLLSDPQIRAYLLWVSSAVLTVTLWRMSTSGDPSEETFRHALFNLVSIMSSTGFSTGSFADWGSFAIIVALWLGLIGACSGSSAAGLSVFRVQLMLAAVKSSVRKIHSAHRIAPVKYGGRSVERETMDALILYVGAFILTFGVISVLMVESGVDHVSALFAAWTSIGNIGYGYGPLVVRTGTFAEFPETAKVLMILAMIMGRLSLLAVFVVMMPRFWRD